MSFARTRKASGRMIRARCIAIPLLGGSVPAAAAGTEHSPQSIFRVAVAVAVTVAVSGAGAGAGAGAVAVAVAGAGRADRWRRSIRCLDVPKAWVRIPR